jgi:tetratricopeptide (TPR) repeat protein
VDALAPLLGDVRRAVRIEAARVLAGAESALPMELQPAWQRAAGEYVATLRYNADRPEANVALGGFYGATGRPDEARAAFERALRLDAGFVPAYVNAADVLRVIGREAEAVAMLERGLAQVPDGAALHHALGLARVRGGDVAGAMGSLQRAAELDPDSARYAYVYAVALHSTGQAEKAIGYLGESLRRWPRDRDMLLALASLQAEAGRPEAARETARRLLEAHPSDRDAQAFAAQLGVAR